MSEKIKSIAVIGTGNLGKRHVQSALFAKDVTKLYAVDPSRDALNEVEQILDQTRISDRNIQFIPITSIADLPLKLDLVIIATNSKIRLGILKEIVTNRKISFLILEKFLFPEEQEYEEAASLFEEKSIKAYVNTPRRAFSYYKELKKSINSSDRNIFTVSAGNLRVGTHGIHFLDLFSFLLNDAEISEINTDGLDDIIYESKRSGYIELEGSLVFRSGRSTMLFQTYDVKGMPLQVSIETPGRRYIIMENNKVAYESDDNTDWKWEGSPFDKPMQSQLTNLIVDQLSETGSCDLPEYKISAKLHLNLLRALFMKLEEIENKKVTRCNIT